MRIVRRWAELCGTGFRCHGEILLIGVVVILLAWQVNLYPFEIVPHYDSWWVQGLFARKLLTCWNGVTNFEIPGIDLYSNFGFRWFGEHWGVMGVWQFLMPLMGVRPAMFTGQIILNLLGAVGAFLYLRHLTGKRLPSLIGGLSFISAFGVLFDFNYYVISLQAMLLLPLFLLFVHRCIERRSGWDLFGFVLVSTAVFTTGDVWSTFFIYPAVGLLYPFIISWRYYGRSLIASVKNAVLLFGLALLAGCVFLVPFSAAIKETGDSHRELLQKWPGRVQPLGPVAEHMRFLPFLKNHHLPSPIVPKVSGGAPMYVPFAFYVALAGGVVFVTRRPKTQLPGGAAERAAMGFLLLGGGALGALLLCVEFFETKAWAHTVALWVTLGAALFALLWTWGEHRKLMSVAAGLFLIAMSMIGLSALYKSDLGFRLAPDMVGQGYAWTAVDFHLCVMPLLVMLAGFLALATVSGCESRLKKVLIYATILGASAAWDWWLMADGPWAQPAAPGPHGDTNRFLLRIDYLSNLWWLNLLPLGLWVIGDLLSGGGTTGRPARIARGCVAMLVAAFAFFNVSLQYEWSTMAQAKQMLFEPRARDPYRWDNYRARQARIDELIDRADPNYRTLYTGPGRVRPTYGRDIRAVVEPEMHLEKPYKALWQLNEYRQHVYDGLMYGAVTRTGSSDRYQYPPLGRRIPDSIEHLRYIGVRYVIAYDKKIESPDLILRGESDSEVVAPARVRLPTDAGRMFVYEIRDAPGVAFLANVAKIRTLAESLDMIHDRSDTPWSRGEVWIEEPFGDPPRPSTQAARRPGTAGIVRQTANRVFIEADAPSDQYLVLSFIRRANWGAFVNDKPVAIRRAFGGFMCVRVPAGKHRVEFRYIPRDVHIGLLLTLLAFVLVPFLRRAL